MSHLNRPKNSDVSVFMKRNEFRCGACLLNKEGDLERWLDPMSFYAHLMDHIAAGHRVQTYTLRRLKEMAKMPEWKSRVSTKGRRKKERAKKAAVKKAAQKGDW